MKELSPAQLKKKMNARKVKRASMKKESQRLKKNRDQRTRDRRAQKKKDVVTKKEAEAREAVEQSEEAVEQHKLSEAEKAKILLARRELARRHLLSFQQYIHYDMITGWFNQDLCRRLEGFLDDVIAEKEPRLMLFVPPRHGKSMTCSQDFPAWGIGKHPHLEFINTSYAETLQLDFSKKTQQTIRSPEYQQLFPGIIIPRNHEAISRWQIGLENPSGGGYRLTGGGMLAAGVGGPMSGRGAHVGTVDDPVKNREEADSETIRASMKGWYSSTFYTRLAPGGGILVVQTRWHDDDMSGWLLSEMAKAAKEHEETGVWPEDADRWEVISYPAIATQDEKYRKKGEALHPERYNLMSLLKKKRTMIPRDWSALYQQNPVAEEGQYFTKRMIRYYEPKERPQVFELDIYVACDLAISKHEDADYTVMVVAGLDEKDNIWILDVRRGRWSTDEIIAEMVSIYKSWKPIRYGIERDKVAIAVKDPLDRAIRENKLREFQYEELHIAGRDKRLRARPIQARMAQGQVLIPIGASWTDQWVNEHLRFDAGTYDDCVDAHAWLGQMLRTVQWTGGRGRQKPEKSWKARLSGYVKKDPSDDNSHMGA